MPCVKLKRAICEGSPATQPFDCSALHGLRAGGWGGGRFPLVGQTVIMDPCYLMSGASRWELSREKTHSAGLSHSACVCERERASEGGESTRHEISERMWKREWELAACMFSLRLRKCAPPCSLFVCPADQNTRISPNPETDADLIYGGLQ